MLLVLPKIIAVLQNLTSNTIVVGVTFLMGLFCLTLSIWIKPCGIYLQGLQWVYTCRRSGVRLDYWQAEGWKLLCMEGSNICKWLWVLTREAWPARVHSRIPAMDLRRLLPHPWPSFVLHHWSSLTTIEGSPLLDIDKSSAVDMVV